MIRNRGAGGLLLFPVLALLLHAQPQTMREAAQLDASGRCREAETFYQTALSRGAPSPALLNNSGNHYLVCGETAKAKTYFEKLLQLRPDHPNANLQLARIAAEQRQGKKALEYLTRVKETGPLVSLLQAEALHWAGKTGGVSALLDGVEKQAAGDPRLLYLLGITSARIGLYARAEKAFTAALARQPGNFDIVYSLGRAAARAGHYDRAVRALETARKIQPENVDLLLELGKACAAREDYIRAVYVLAQARKKAPRRPDVLRTLAEAAYEANYYDDSAKIFDEYLQLRPNDDLARRDRARACGATDARREEGHKELQWYLRKHPKDPIGHFIYAQMFWDSDPEDALNHLTEAARLDPEAVSIRFSRAWMLQRLGQIEESLPDLEAANRLAPNNPRILDLLGLAYLALDRPADAEKAFRQALASSPDVEPKVLMHLGRALMMLDKEEEAQVFMERYRKRRPTRLPGLQRRFGLLKLATLSAEEQRKQEIKRFRDLASKQPDRPTYQLRLASLLLADGRREEALREFRVLLKRNASGEVWEEAGSLLVRTGEYDLARQFLERAVKTRPSARPDLAVAIFHLDGPGQALAFLEKLPAAEMTGDILLLKAEILYALGRKAQAEQTLNSGLEHASGQPSMVEKAVLLLVHFDRGKEAVGLLDRVIPENPRNVDLPLLKAIVLGLMQQFSPSEKILRDIESRWPEWDRAYLVHGLVLEAAKQPAEARRKLQTAAALGSKDPSLECALARLGGKSKPSPKCDCLKGLRQLLYPDCGDQKQG